MTERVIVGSWVLAAAFGWSVGQVLTVNSPEPLPQTAIAVTPELLQEVTRQGGRGHISALKCGFSDQAFYESMHEVQEELRLQHDTLSQISYNLIRTGKWK